MEAVDSLADGANFWTELFGRRKYCNRLILYVYIEDARQLILH